MITIILIYLVIQLYNILKIRFKTKEIWRPGEDLKLIRVTHL
jgi:hypothetical protein